MLDQVCKKLKMEKVADDVVSKMAMLSLIPQKDAKEQQIPKQQLFETDEKNVFLIKKVNREDLRRRLRDTEIGEVMQDRRKNFVKSKGVTYFDQKANTTKRFITDELDNPNLENGRRSLIRIF